MTYAVKELFYTLQGEGAQAGRPAVFCRFAGCNLWTGREADREQAVCRFCDTDFVGTDGPGGGKFRTAEDLAAAAMRLWPGGGKPYVVCTGGEPLLQLDAALIDAFHAAGFEIAIESNGTLPAPPGIDWICISPKSTAPLVQTSGDELKLVFPQEDAMPERFAGLDFHHFFLQPMDGRGPDAAEVRARNTQAALAYCLEHPQWRLGLQTHKILDIP
ncbi:MAG TPA: 7-carboxy-7-deazaguanine synthase [Sphingomonadales bacterium]